MEKVFPIALLLDFFLSLDSLFPERRAIGFPRFYRWYTPRGGFFPRHFLFYRQSLGGSCHCSSKHLFIQFLNGCNARALELIMKFLPFIPISLDKPPIEEGMALVSRQVDKQAFLP